MRERFRFRAALRKGGSCCSIALVSTLCLEGHYCSTWFCVMVGGLKFNFVCELFASSSGVRKHLPRYIVLYSPVLGRRLCVLFANAYDDACFGGERRGILCSEKRSSVKCRAASCRESPAGGITQYTVKCWCHPRGTFQILRRQRIRECVQNRRVGCVPRGTLVTAPRHL